MKKILSVAVAATLGAGAFSASAAEVTLYGRADLGLSYHAQRTTYPLDTQAFSGTVVNDTKSWSMDSGNWTGSRFGMKGTEELGNGWKVGFVLENGFKADTGTMGNSSKIFDREATLSVTTNEVGTIYAGRMGAIVTDASSVGFYAGMVSPFGTGMGDIAGHAAVMAMPAIRWDNAVAYVSPTVSGITVYGQYAMGNTHENKATDSRYAALGASYVYGPVQLAFVADYLNKPTAGVSDLIDLLPTNYDKSVDDTWTVNLGGSYDFDVAQVFAAGQYFHGASNPANLQGAFGDAIYAHLLDHGFQGDRDQFNAAYDLVTSLNGFGVNLGVAAPVFGGTAKLSGGYMQTSGEDKLKAYTVLAGYEYPFSKRTSVYAAAGMTQLKEDDFKSTKSQVAAGLVHRF